jgi:hypothetical protein
LLQVRQSLQREQPDLVVVLITVENDVIAHRSEHIPPAKPTLIKRFRIPRNLSRAELIDAVVRPFNDVLETRSHLFILARRQAHTFRMRLGLSPLNLPEHYYRRSASLPAWDTTAALLSDIARVTSADTVPAFFVLLPSDYQVDPDAFDEYVRGFGLDPASIDLALPNSRLAELMRARGLRVIDALPALRVERAAGKRLYGAVDPHLSPEGHRVVARLLEPEIVNHLGARPRPVRVTATKQSTKQEAMQVD